MRRLAAFLSLSLVFLAAQSTAAPGPDTPPVRRIAVTIDDLPAGAASWMTGDAIVAMTSQLLGTLRDQKVPVVGFVNERKLYYHWGQVDQRIQALKLWLDNGFELGNHTYAHTSLNNAGLTAFEEGVVQGESVISLLMAQYNKKVRFFRHPYLDTGRDLETRRAAEAFLAQRGYHIAPVTMDAWDWMFASLYDDAKKRGDTAFQKDVVSSYLAYHAVVFDYYEKLSKDLMGYEPRQILLLHANQLEADHIGELLDMIRKRGYQFITLEEALEDDAYSLPDTYVGEEGRGWIEHWAITRGRPPLGAPVAPADMHERYKALPKLDP